MSAYRFIRSAAEQAQPTFSVAFLCVRLGVARSGYYAWRQRPPSAREQADAALRATIQQIHTASRGTYGMPRIHAALRDAHQMRCGRKRVARLMRQAGLRGVCRRGVRTTRRAPDAVISDDLVWRQFRAAAPNHLGVADITYLPTWQGFLYLAVVIDAYSRKVVDWSMAAHLRIEHQLGALEMALWLELPQVGGQVRTGDTAPDGVHLHGETAAENVHAGVALVQQHG